MTRADIVIGWKEAFKRAGMMSGTVEAERAIADCAAREVAERLKCGETIIQ